MESILRAVEMLQAERNTLALLLGGLADCSEEVINDQGMYLEDHGLGQWTSRYQELYYTRLHNVRDLLSKLEAPHER